MSVLIYFGLMGFVVIFGFFMLGLSFYQWRLENKKKQLEMK